MGKFRILFICLISIILISCQSNKSIIQIEFNTNGGSFIASKDYIIGDLTIDFEAPQKTGHTFQGWFIDNVTFNTPFSIDILEGIEEGQLLLHAKWAINEYEIKFETNSDIIIDSIYYDYMENVPELPLAETEGFIFAGWYLDELFTIPFNIIIMPSNDLIVYAKWNPVIIATKLIIHYHRNTGDYDGWNIWLWPNEPVSSGGNTYNFNGTDEHGQVLTIDLTETNLMNSVSIGLVVKLREWDAKDINIDRYIDMSKPNEHGEIIIYLYQGEIEIYTENQLS